MIEKTSIQNDRRNTGHIYDKTRSAVVQLPANRASQFCRKPRFYVGKARRTEDSTPAVWHATDDSVGHNHDTKKEEAGLRQDPILFDVIRKGKAFGSPDKGLQP